MELGKALRVVGQGERSEAFDVFCRSLDIAWVRRALDVTETASIRRRKLPAEFVVWLVIGMALLRDRSIEEVVRHLNLVVPELRRPDVTRGAIIQARDRLGCEALASALAKTDPVSLAKNDPVGDLNLRGDW
jgi:hypothetical protein